MIVDGSGVALDVTGVPLTSNSGSIDTIIGFEDIVDSRMWQNPGSFPDVTKL
jgi:hypothetical protein